MRGSIILLLPPTTYESSKTKKKMDLLYIKNKENVYIKMEFCVVFIFWREIAVRAVSQLGSELLRQWAPACPAPGLTHNVLVSQKLKQAQR